MTRTKAGQLKAFDGFYEDLMLSLDILDEYEGSHEQKTRRWLSHALDEAEKRGEQKVWKKIAELGSFSLKSYPSLRELMGGENNQIKSKEKVIFYG